MEAYVRIENAGNYSAEKNHWTGYNNNTYIKLKEGVDARLFSKKAQPFIDKYFTEDINLAKISGVSINKDKPLMSMGMLPLSDFHHDTKLRGGGASKSSIYGMMGLAVLYC